MLMVELERSRKKIGLLEIAFNGLALFHHQSGEDEISWISSLVEIVHELHFKQPLNR